MSANNAFGIDFGQATGGTPDPNPTFETIALNNEGSGGGFNVTAVGGDGLVTYSTANLTTASSFAGGPIFAFQQGVTPSGNKGHAQLTGGDGGIGLAWISPGDGTTYLFASGDTTFDIQNLASVNNIPVTKAYPNLTFVDVSSGTAISPTASEFGTFYNITITGINSIVLPSLVAGNSGGYWVFRNNSSANLTITLTNGTVNGLSSITIGQLNSATIMYTGTSTAFTLF
jgi:uncharacterized membrane protein